MDTLKRFFANPWTKRGFSLLSLPYAAMLCWFAYLSVFFEITITSPVGFGVRMILMCALSLVVMFYTRKTVVTTIVCTLPLLCLLPIVLMNLGNWILIIPPCAVSLVMFFLSGAGEGGKTVFGTTILLVYMLGTLGFFVYTGVLAPSTQTSIALDGDSPSGIYHYSETYAQDKTDGSTYVDITTNAFDGDYGWMHCDARGFSRRYVTLRPMQECKIEWKTEKRSDITAALLAVNPEMSFTLNETQLTKLNLMTNYKQTFDVEDLTSEQLEGLKIVLSSKKGIPAGMTLYTEDEITLTVEQMHTAGIVIGKQVALSTLTEAQLNLLGVPETGDVLYVNDKPVFRYYTAILKNEFTKGSRAMNIF